jgi:hypothetical protein
MDIGYGDHHCYQKSILIHHNMSFDPFYFFIAIDPVERPVISPPNTLAIQYPKQWFPALTLLFTNFSSQMI